MRQVTVRTDELKVRLKANRATHRAQYEKAIEGWARECLQTLQQDIDALRNGVRRRLTLMDPMPEDHTADYDCVLAMLEMSVDENQVLEHAVFRQYVLDDWQWKHNWVASNSKYNIGA